MYSITVGLSLPDIIYHLNPARGKSSAAIEGRGHYRTLQERRQDGVRKLPRHFVRVARGYGAP